MKAKGSAWHIWNYTLIYEGYKRLKKYVTSLKTHCDFRKIYIKHDTLILSSKISLYTNEPI